MEKSVRVSASSLTREVLFSLEILSTFLLLAFNSAEIDAQNKIGGAQQFSRLDLSTDLGIESSHFSPIQLSYSIMQRPTLGINSPSLHCSPPDTMVVDTNADRSTVRLLRSMVSDSTAADTSVVVIRQKSALTAVLLSAVIPGGGQIYNGSYWKVPIIYGLQAFFVYEWISNNKSYHSFWTQWQDSVNAGASNYIIAQLQGDRDGYHDQRDSYAWYIAGVYALSLLDAYVDAELSGFDISPSLGLAPDGSASAAVLVRLKF